MTEFLLRILVVAGVVLTPVIYFQWGITTRDKQIGPDGTGMDLVMNEAVLDEIEAANKPPLLVDIPVTDEQPGEWVNVQVLSSLSSTRLNRLMINLTNWVSPTIPGRESETGCNYCHVYDEETKQAINHLDTKYPKRVARRMLQMTQHINMNWQTRHVQQTGVTCYTCHRGQPVPKYYWYEEPRNQQAYTKVGNPMEQNTAGSNVTLASLPNDVFTPFLEQDNNIRVISETFKPYRNRQSIKQAEWTYGLMVHMSDSLAVGCTYCHNSRSFGEWAQSPPARTTAYHGIRMVREINTVYTTSLVNEYPAYRLGELGDAPKANCKTCHQGAYKPLLGYSLWKEFPSLRTDTSVIPPPPDADGDGVTDYRNDQCIDEPEVVNDYRDSDGCPDEVPEGIAPYLGTIDGLVFITDDRLNSRSLRYLTFAALRFNVVEDLKLEIQVQTVAPDGDVEALVASAQTRAEAIKRQLVSASVPEEAIATVGTATTSASQATATTNVRFVVP